MTNFDDLCSLISSKVPYADLPYQNKTGVGHLLKDKYQQYLNATNTYLTIEPEICRNLLDAWESYINDPDEAYKQFSNAMRFIEEDILAVSKYYRKFRLNNYYKARYSSSDKLTKRSDLFHLPFELKPCFFRYSTDKQHFLYLGATPYICYMELGDSVENTDDLYFSRYELPDTYTLLSVGILPYEMLDFVSEDYKQKVPDLEALLTHYIRILPLIMASSIKKSTNTSIGDPEEYYIPQLLTRWVLEHHNTYDGIEYFSNAVPTHSRYNYRLYHNVVIPAKKELSTGFCPELSNELKLTKQFCINGINLYGENYTDPPIKALLSNGRIPVPSDDNREVHYSTSGFHHIEYILSTYPADYVFSQH